MNTIGIDSASDAPAESSLQLNFEGRFEETIGQAEMTVAISRKFGDRFGLGWALHGMGLARIHLGQFGQADPDLRAARETGRAMTLDKAVAYAVQPAGSSPSSAGSG